MLNLKQLLRSCGKIQPEVHEQFSNKPQQVYLLHSCGNFLLKQCEQFSAKMQQVNLLHFCGKNCQHSVNTQHAAVHAYMCLGGRRHMCLGGQGLPPEARTSLALGQKFVPPDDPICSKPTPLPPRRSAKFGPPRTGKTYY